MLEKAELPFRKFFRSTYEAESGLADAPMLFSIEVEGVTAFETATHSTALQVPLAPTVNSIEVSSIVFQAARGSLLRRIYLFMQRLDSEGTANGPPVPLAATDSTKPSVPLKLKLFTGDRVRLLLFQNGTGPAVTEVILSGCILNNADFYFAPSTPSTALLSWKPEPFRPVQGTIVSASRKRSRSPQPVTKHENHVSDDEPPTLVYASVFGGDDES
ncbi:hypothetical protein GH5_06284 [Leishmania sp. Ghana 2012 LV757]|uniref:hypothetical protein n=1 Tax=Leishmania sp. Ghana 2012 LV757 TaxID=2803181 RepID=UPI001B66717C|nr:hypothetical protein GH5_06284 [Leishmania sp. Ghana 2012 LV757]